MNPYLKSNMQHLETKKKLACIIGIVLLVRFISDIPLPFVNRMLLDALKENALANGLIGMMTGGSFGRLSIFALSIAPYITSSITLQLLSVAIPSLAELPKSGKVGEEKYKRITGAFAVFIAFVHATLMAIGLGRQGVLVPYTPGVLFTCSVIWTAGTGLLVAIGNLMDNFSLGQGISWLLLANILATIPEDVQRLLERILHAPDWKEGAVTALASLVIIACIMLACTFITTSERHLPVLYSGQLSGTISEARSVFIIPLVTCSVMPLIFAGSITAIPAMASRFNSHMNAIAMFMSPSMWFRREMPMYSLGAIFYVGMSFLFTAFYLEISFNGYEIAAKLRECGGVVHDLYPGAETGEYLRRVIRRTAFSGNALLSGLVVFMYAVTNLSGLSNMSMGSTSAIIAVALINDLLRRVHGETIQFKRLPALSTVGRTAEEETVSLGELTVLSKKTLLHTFGMVVDCIAAASAAMWCIDTLAAFIVLH